MTTPTIEDRISCWKQAFDVVYEELVMIDRRITALPTRDPIVTADTAARVAATLAVGATVRRRGAL